MNIFVRNLIFYCIGLEVVVLMANVQSHVEDLRKTFVEMTRTIY